MVAIDQMQFILGLKPLNMNVPMPQMSRGGSAEVHTAAEARQKATQQLESLNTIVQNASGILVALSRAAERHIQNKQASVAARNSSVAVQVLGSRQVQKGDATQQATQSDESIKANNNKRAMLLAMFLSGSGVGVCVGSVLLSANIF
ncbi:hypothetical protein IW140_004637 [Coemansia sp. RSA 1813]|nr:hypothetical protein IW140_004637 [Coemansia sp. RSA 1813]